MEKYSVLMSVYCKEQATYFKTAIDSMLAQTVPPDDFVLVCDGPLTFELDAIIEEYCKKMPKLFNVIRLSENKGLGNALKIGVEACKYELIARMDTDDISLPDRCEKQLKMLSENPEISVVGGQISEFYDDPKNVIDYRIVPTSYEEIKKRAAKRNPMNHVTVMLKKSQVLLAGNYYDIPGFEDYHLWVQMLSAGLKLQNIEDVCCNVRVDRNMYGRRGGLTYFKRTLEMECFLLKSKLITIPHFCVNVAVRFCGTVLCPDFIKEILFKKFLRKTMF